MPVFYLNEQIVFPAVELANPDGILAVGGDLSPERVLAGYTQGIFPWYSDGDPILWWSPDPRFVLFTNEFRLSKTMRKIMKKHQFTITADTCFDEVIEGCRTAARPDQPGTWITDEMLGAYCHLHKLGFAHSIEAWEDDQLAGGLYGVSIGRIFFGESMFTRVPNASKVAFAFFVNKLAGLGFPIIDSQVHTHHLESFGAREIPRIEYLAHLDKALDYKTIKGAWTDIIK